MDLNTILYGQGQSAPVPPQSVLPQAPMQAPLEAPTQTPRMPEQTQVMQQEGISGQGSGQGFFDKLRSDPALHQAMLMMGARLMQGPKQGQNELGVLGDATAVAAQVHNMLQTNERTMQTDEAKAGALINRENAGAEAVRGEEQRRTQAFPQTQVKVAEEIKQLRAQGNLNEARALQEQWKADPKKMSEERQLDLDKTRAQIGASNASAAASYASAASSRANAEYTGERTAAAKKLNQEGSPDAVLHGTKSGAAGAKAKFAELETYIKAAHPDWTTEQVAQNILDMQTGKKGEELEVLRLMAESDDKEHRKYAAAKLAARAGYKAGQAGDLPAGVTEEDIQYTMKKRNMTRAQVLENLNKGK